jgi:hypothetical protein
MSRGWLRREVIIEREGRKGMPYCLGDREAS